MDSGDEMTKAGRIAPIKQPNGKKKNKKVPNWSQRKKENNTT